MTVHATSVFRRRTGGASRIAMAGEGCYVIDDAGNRLLDAGSGRFVTNIGHGNVRVIEAIRAQLEQVAFAHAGDFTSEVELRFTRRLLELAPAGMSAVWTCLSGSDANETALKLARQYHLVRGRPEKHRIIARRMAYHGSSPGALALTGVPARREGYEPYLFDVTHIDPPCAWRDGRDPDDPATGRAYADLLEQAILDLGPEHVAAFFVEAVSGGPLAALVPPPGYLARVREICDAHDVLLVADEVVGALGRTGRAFAVDHCALTPDLITVAKGIAGGYVPIGAVLAHERVVGPFAAAGSPFRHMSTFAGSPVVAAAGEAVLAETRRLGLIARAAERGAQLARRLDGLRDLPIVGDVRGLGLLQGIEFVADRVTRAPFPCALRVAERVADACEARGVLVIANQGLADGINGDNVTLAPPLIVSPEEIDLIADVLGEAIAEVGRALAATP